ncbi:MAG: sugar transferase [Syntrophus sp. (in: bacteria)]|nr:sugar transferase [Syntrophus sp. (in: bacteria)]
MPYAANMTACIGKAWENERFPMKQDRGMVRRIELIVDVLLTLLVFVCARAIEQSLLADAGRSAASSPDYYAILPMIAIIWYVTLDFFSFKHQYGVQVTWAVVLEVFKGVTISMVLLVVGMYFFKITDVGRPLIFLFYISDLAVLILARWMIDRFVFSTRRVSYFDRHILILGSRTTAQDLVKLICKQNLIGIKVVGCIELDREDLGKEVACGIRVVGTLDDLKEILLNQVIDEVLITMPLNEINNSEWYLSFMNTFGITVRIIPDWYMRKFMNIHASHAFRLDRFLTEPALVISRIQKNQDALAIKAIMDYVLALFALILAFPLFVVIPCLIKLSSPGPIFFKQIRSGQDGRKFPLFKFRTMIAGAEESQYTLIELNEADGPVFKIEKDPRIIPYLGTFLRKFGLDEVPQFINVIRGEMSIVGPRPPTPAEVEKYELWQRRRLSMKPGITCIWQIQPRRNEITFDEWMNMDMDYIDHWSLWLDIKIMLKTVPAALLGHGR